MIDYSFKRAELTSQPFPHAVIPAILDEAEARHTLRSLEDSSPWRLRVEDFYEQHEFSLLETGLSPHLRELASPALIERLIEAMDELFEERLRFVDASVHRLTSGQTIRVHNDHIGDEESHRLLVQINDGWTPDWGGLLMLFGSDDPADVSDVVAPISGSGFAFEISPRSHHAVSTAHAGQRYTLVYTFRRR